MGYLTELAIGFGRLVASEIDGTLKAILGNIRLLQLTDEDASPEESTSEPLFTGLGLYARPQGEQQAIGATGLHPEGVCEVVGIRMDDRFQPLAYRDLRLASQVNPGEGDVGLVHYGGGFVTLKWNTDEDGSNVMLYAPRKNAGGTVIKASCISMDSTDGNQHVSIMHESGASITITKDAKIVVSNKTGDAYLEVNDSAITLNGKAVIPGSAVVGATDPASAQFVMLSTQMLVWIGQVYSCLSALNAAFPGIITLPTAVPAPSQWLKAV